MIVEFRIPLPIGVNDFEVAQLYMVAKLQENVTGGGEGVIVLKNEPLILFAVNYLDMIILMVIWVFQRSVVCLFQKIKDSILKSII